MLDERDDDSSTLGQFIPVHYHHNMLMDGARMQSFKAAIRHTVFEGAKVLELGGGTGVLSCFAAATASKVWCVELNAELVREARRILALNPDGARVEVVHADALHYLPPEPVDVVICEMIHVGMLREKQVEMMDSFRRRYLAHFGDPLPAFVPEAAVMAVQPMCQDYDFDGFHAPIVQFFTHGVQQGTLAMAEPSVYSTLDFTSDTEPQIAWRGCFAIARNGTVNAMRFITKNILRVLEAEGSTIDWLNHYMVLPLEHPVPVAAGDMLEISFSYRAGGSIPSLQKTLTAQVVPAGAAQRARA